MITTAPPISHLWQSAQVLHWRDVPRQAVDDYRKIAAQVEGLEKQAYSETLRAITDALNLTPGTYPGGIPNQASPLAGTLTGGLVGAGLGYGAGWLGEQILPERWQRGRLRKTLAVLGGLGGAIPGMAQLGLNHYTGRSLNDRTLFSGRPEPNDPPFPGTRPMPTSLDVNQYLPPLQSLGKQSQLDAQINPTFRKLAADYGATGARRPLLVNVNQFNQVVWDDPRIADKLPISARAAASGLVQGAAELSGNDSGWITPMDIGRMTAGMGVGYMSGALVGKGLGLLMGMPEETQESLKNTGYYAGAISSLVNTAFGR